MPYFAPYIDETGLHIPTYSDLRDDLVQQAKNIFGQDIYLENDSMDYQFISVVAERIYSCYLALQSSYNARSPKTAIGQGLDGLIKLNGLARKASTYSTCPVVVSGTAGTIISNGIVGDISGNNWLLPASVTIPAEGNITVTATAEKTGPIVAQPGDINKIITPVKGWLFVTNDTAATPGQAQETDAQLRARQSVSTSIAAQTPFESLLAGLANISGVTRVKGYENDTDNVSSEGFPAHSVTVVVEGGDQNVIANTILNRKTIGCYTNGTTAIEVTDINGITTIVRFYRPTYIDLDVEVTVKDLGGYTDSQEAGIKQNIADYLNSVKIGQNGIISALYSPALAAMPDLRTPAYAVTQIRAAKHGETLGLIDIPVLFNEVLRGNTAYVTVIVT